MADGTQPAEMPLTGVRVLDLGRHLAGPTCAMLLGDLGADVIKVEKPGVGEDGRAAGPPFFSGISAFFLSANRNKRSLTLDIKRAAGQAVFHRLAETADVVVENFRPGVMDALGIGYAASVRAQSADHLLRNLRVRRQWSLRRSPGTRSDHPGRLRVDERDRFRGR
jgi:crotonobetainyl-CoA:carnitine CoA-transferase CaiB-like acyl-CoA transferase